MATTKGMKAPAKKNRYNELREMLEGRRRELMNEVQGRIRDVRGGHPELGEGRPGCDAGLEDGARLELCRGRKGREGLVGELRTPCENHVLFWDVF